MISLDEIDILISEKMVTRRKHESLPLCVYNYSAKAQHLPLRDWSYTLRQCRGLILDDNGEIVGRPFAKFWNYSQVLDEIPSHEPFTVWEKLDGSLGIVCSYRGHRVVATRGSFDSDQARWAAQFLANVWPSFRPPEDSTFLFEVIFPANRIVVDYGDRKELVLLAVLDRYGRFQDEAFDWSIFPKARRFDGVEDFATIDDNPAFDNHEGFVVRWKSGFLAKVKRAEYVRLHRLITQCSTRTIWELLRAGESTDELVDHVPEDFKIWAVSQINSLRRAYNAVEHKTRFHFAQAPQECTRKDFAEYARTTPYPGLLFSLLDGRPINDAIWKLVEPQWATPFRCGGDE